MSRKHVHDRIDRLERKLTDAVTELAELRAWRDGHVCAPLSYQPVPIPNAVVNCTCATTGGWCPLHGSGWQQPYRIWLDSQPGMSYTIPVTSSTPFWTAANVCSGAAGAVSTFTVTQPTLRQVWPPKNPPDEPDMGVPALA